MITTGGLFGEVVSVDSATVILKIADNVRVKISKSNISGMQGGATAEGGS